LDCNILGFSGAEQANSLLLWHSFINYGIYNKIALATATGSRRRSLSPLAPLKQPGTLI